MAVHAPEPDHVPRETVTRNDRQTMAAAAPPTPRPEPEKGHHPYSDDDLALIEALLASDWTVKNIAHHLKRSYGALRVKLHRIGKTTPQIRTPGGRPPGPRPRAVPDRRRRQDREIETESPTKTAA